jgi:hypothetical protein
MHVTFSLASWFVRGCGSVVRIGLLMCFTVGMIVR